MAGKQRRFKTSVDPETEDFDPSRDWLDADSEEVDSARLRATVKVKKTKMSLAAEQKVAEISGSGVVVVLWSGGCRVQTATGERDGVLASYLAADQQSSLAIGDTVRFDETSGGQLRVHEVLPRRTRLARADPQNPRLERVIAANVDVVVIVVSVKSPPLRPALIDRYLIAIARGGAEPLLCVNKIDLLAAADRQTIDAVLQPYRALEIATFFCSTHLGQGIDALAERLRGKVAAVVGHSGVGKSSIINALDPEAAARVKEVGDNKKGRHTTTRSRLYRLSRDIQLIDTPGIRELGLPGLTRNDLAYFFPDLVELGSDCRFADCRHLSEPDCAVRSAAERNQKVGARLATFHRLHASLDT